MALTRNQTPETSTYSPGFEPVEYHSDPFGSDVGGGTAVLGTSTPDA